ncbi:MAG: hypothetical protein FWC03_02290 [Treponema sp.]|nr:hypothetical protein [Treponema sp.]
MSIFYVILFFVVNIFPVYSLDLPSTKIADDSSVRIRRNDWFTESHSRLLARRPVIEQLQNGERVQIRATENASEFMVLFSRELIQGRIETENSAAVTRRGTNQFPGWAQGSWMLTRRKDNGAPTRLRIFPRSDPNTYIEFYPFNTEKCLMDAILYGGYVVRSLPVAVPFERLYTMQLNDILKLVSDKFPRKYFDPDPVYYGGSRKFVSQVRANLSGLRFADDGAIDENGNYVLIDSLRQQNQSSAGLNCSGFLKWMIDGILRPVTGKRLPIAQLKAPFGDRGSSFTAVWEERFDPYFGLDWIRNLAAEANGTLRSDIFRSLNEFEVRADNFSSVLINDRGTFVTRSYPGFMNEAGYSFEGLHSLLYTLAIDEPFSFYLAAINTETGPATTQDNPRGAPRLRQYFHVAALVPYFDEYGVFRIAVFESSAENSFESFRNRYPGHFINLVQVPIPSAFSP